MRKCHAALLINMLPRDFRTFSNDLHLDHIHEMEHIQIIPNKIP